MVVALACTAFSPDDCPAVRPFRGEWGFGVPEAVQRGGLSPFGLADVCFGSGADIQQCQSNVRYSPESGHPPTRLGCPFCAKSGHRLLRALPLAGSTICGSLPIKARHIVA